MAQDEILVVIETDKVAVDVRATLGGIVEETLAAAGACCCCLHAAAAAAPGPAVLLAVLA